MKKTSNYHSKKDVQSGSKFSKDSTKKSFDKKRKSSDFESSENSSKEHKKTFTKSEKPAYKKYSKDSSEDKSKKPYSSKTSDFKKTDKKFVAKGEKPTYNKYKQEDSEDKSKKPYNSRTSDFKKTDKKFTFKKEEKPFYKKTRGEDSGYKTSYKKNSDDKSDAKEDKKSFKKSSGFKSKNERSSFKDKNTPTYNLKFYEDKYKKEVKEEKTENGDIRLNKFIANAGVCSRREADDLITQGFVKVNGKTITEMGYQVKPSDKVSYKGKLLQREKLVYILLNKPKNCITTTDDPEERHTVMEIVKDACEERVYPVGRLDRNTTGLLLLTNDGDLAKRLAHPSNNIRKIYQVGLDKPISETDYLKIQEGLELEDGFIKPDALALLTPDTLGIELHSGRNRIVRRIFEHLGYSVEKLDRTMYAGLTKKDLPRGKWRFLNQKEVVLLKFSKIRKSPVKKISQK
ncbi:MAG: pseudouridine synthase [Raineya sp.]|nr:pseudouridine synthase [Raineya sp.]